MKECEWCGKQFDEPGYYCSPECRKKAQVKYTLLDMRNEIREGRIRAEKKLVEMRTLAGDRAHSYVEMQIEETLRRMK